jgi:hypothetical protein
VRGADRARENRMGEMYKQECFSALSMTLKCTYLVFDLTCLSYAHRKVDVNRAIGFRLGEVYDRECSSTFSGKV